MRSDSTTLRRRCASCLVVSAIALASACRRLDAHDDAGIADTAQPVAAIAGDAVLRAHGALGEPGPSMQASRGGAVPSLPGARRALASSPSDIRDDPPMRNLGAGRAPAERAPRAPRRGLAPSRPADDRRGLAAIRRHRAPYLVRATDGTGADRAPARSSGDVDLPRHSTIAPHRALLRQLMGL
jgi:hypothetical protein